MTSIVSKSSTMVAMLTTGRCYDGAPRQRCAVAKQKFATQKGGGLADVDCHGEGDVIKQSVCVMGPGRDLT